MKIRKSYYDKEHKYIKRIIYYDDKGYFHNEDGPADIEYYKSGNIKCEKYYTHDSLNNENGPALIEYYNNTNVSFMQYYVNGYLHRVDGPASIEIDRNGNILKEVYYQNGKDHRDGNLPSYIEYDNDGTIKKEAYYIHGNRHKLDGPAYVDYKEDVKKYWINDKLYEDELQYLVDIALLKESK